MTAAVALARSIFERELALSFPIVPKGQEPKEEESMEETGRYDVFYLSSYKTEWLRFALWRTLSDARATARTVSQHGHTATWIRPHNLNEGVIPVGAA